VVSTSLENALERFQFPWNLKAALWLCFIAFFDANRSPVRLESMT